MFKLQSIQLSKICSTPLRPCTEIYCIMENKQTGEPKRECTRSDRIECGGPTIKIGIVAYVYCTYTRTIVNSYYLENQS